MSVYDFNHNDNSNSNHRDTSPFLTEDQQTVSINGTRNVAQNFSEAAREHQNDFMKAINYNSSSGIDRSTNLNRPTSKTAMLVRKRRALLESLSCFICKGYLIDATTIDECMDSFCRSCIILHLRSESSCPKCGVMLHKTNPHSTLVADKTKQDIVYRIVPGLFDEEMKRRREFYRARYNLPPSPSNDTSSSSSCEDEEDPMTAWNMMFPHLTSLQYGQPHPKQYFKPTDNIDVSLEPHISGEDSVVYYDNKRLSIVTTFTGNWKQNPDETVFSPVDNQDLKTYIRCPAKFTAHQIKKFITAKYNLGEDDSVRLLYFRDSIYEAIEDDYSLMDIIYIYKWNEIENLQLFYIIERDLKNDDPEQNYIQNRQPLKTKSDETIETTSQFVKRVCIDPNPRYFELPGFDDGGDLRSVQIGPGGRTMRARNIDKPMSAAEVRPLPPAQAPILRSSSHRPLVRSTPTETFSSSYSSSSSTSTSTTIPSIGSAINGRHPNYLIQPSGSGQATQNHYTTKPMTTVRGQVSKSMNQDPKQIKNHVAEPIPKINIILTSINRSQSGAGELPANRNNNQLTNGTNGGPGDNKPNNIIANSVALAKPQVSQQQQQQLILNSTSNFGLTRDRNNLGRKQQFGSTSTQSSMMTLSKFTMSHTSNFSGPGFGNNDASRRSVFGLESSIASQERTTTTTSSQIVSTATTIQQQPQQIPGESTQAFSIVTERGITIVRRPNNSTEPVANTNNSSNQVVSASKPAIQPANNFSHQSVTQASRREAIDSIPSNPHDVQGSRFSPVNRTSVLGYHPRGTNQQSGQQQLHNNSRDSGSSRTSQTRSSSSSSPTSSISSINLQAIAASSLPTSASPSTSNSNPESFASSNSSTPRHLSKVRPVYRTLVDPTKIKSPNFKKFGYIARH